jgi:hypothetical protein
MKKILYTLPIGFIIACGAGGSEFPGDLDPDATVDTPWGSFYFGDPGDGSCSCRKPGDIQLKSYRPDNSCVCFIPSDDTPDSGSDALTDADNDANVDSSTDSDVDASFDASGDSTTDAYTDANTDSDTDAFTPVDGGVDSSTDGGNNEDASSSTGGTTGSTSGTTGESNTTGGTTGSNTSSTGTTGSNTTGGTSTSSTGTTGTTGGTTGASTSDSGTCSTCPTPVPCNEFGFNCNECYVFSYCTVDGKYQEQIACKTETKAYDEQCTRDSGWDYTQGGYRWYVYLCSK